MATQPVDELDYFYQGAVDTSELDDVLTPNDSKYITLKPYWREPTASPDYPTGAV
ncbi:hypothetical protein GS501_03000 [Saccharibacter sp. 17.LH.SD]|uniref:hypothetical protein n=1 Tax=Saccharibacter sp. 17.LH.SD TaxID=2689393 RepID=UPI0013685559|nr:hypothetical protein [Saccharibacter sp. 17.LH.SD]MXV44021.1 hypothetical protein [Saccharibacter sp. 17.LH.SD]